MAFQIEQVLSMEYEVEQLRRDVLSQHGDLTAFRQGTEVTLQAILQSLKNAEAARARDARFQSLEVERLYRSILRNLTPKSVLGFPKKRVGRDLDGGYVMIDNFAGVEGVVSLGIANEVSFDLELAGQGLPIYQYDDSVDGPPTQHPSFAFTKARIGPKHDAKARHQTLESALATHGLSASKKLILKMDIEGSEWAVLDATPTEVLKQFDQIAIELHHFSKMAEALHFRTQACRALEKLNQSHTPVHVHANNCALVFNMPTFYCSDVLEVTYVRTDSYTLTDCQELFPGPLDRPNNPAFPELFLGRFKFS